MWTYENINRGTYENSNIGTKERKEGMRFFVTKKEAIEASKTKVDALLEI